MRRKNKNSALRAVFLYLLLSGGSWMFINSYANSYNKLSSREIRPAGAVIKDGRASMELLDHNAEFSISGIGSESKAYCVAYLLSADELRVAAYVISLCI